jgi:hypothetical protein
MRTHIRRSSLLLVRLAAVNRREACGRGSSAGSLDTTAFHSVGVRRVTHDACGLPTCRGHD